MFTSPGLCMYLPFALVSRFPYLDHYIAAFPKRWPTPHSSALLSPPPNLSECFSCVICFWFVFRYVHPPASHFHKTVFAHMITYSHGQSCQDVTLTTHIHLVPRLITKAVPPIPIRFERVHRVLSRFPLLVDYFLFETVSFFLSFYLSLYLSIYLSIYLSVYPVS